MDRKSVVRAVKTPSSARPAEIAFAPDDDREATQARAFVHEEETP